jgi:hypothetical protein
MLVTLLAAPKPLAGATAVSRRNAVESWSRLGDGEARRALGRRARRSGS